MTIFNSYVKLPEGTISMNLQSILPHKNDDYDHGVFSSPVHEKPASQPRLASTRHQDAKGQGDPRQRWDLYTGLPALSGFVASVGGLLLLVKRNETNVSPLKGWYNCITLARYGYATNRYIYIYTRIYTYIYIYILVWWWKNTMWILANKHKGQAPFAGRSFVEIRSQKMVS